MRKLFSFTILLMCFSCALLFAQTGGTYCPQNAINQDAIKKSSSVTLIVNSDAAPYSDQSTNQDVVNSIYDGIGAINYDNAKSNASGNGSMVTFTNVDSSSAVPTASSPVINVIIDNTVSDTSDGAGEYRFVSDSNHNIISGTIIIYLSRTDLNVCGGPCYNPNMPGFAAAVSTAMKHELTHFLGIGNATTNALNNGSTLMGDFSGVNNTHGKDSC